MANAILTAEYVRAKLNYDPETGIFTKAHDFGSRFKRGDRADKPTAGKTIGYRRVSLMNEWHLAHRVAWLYVHGEWPKHDVDHVNGDRSDNRICNLREASGSINQQNHRVAHKNNKTGLLGAVRHKDRYRARIVVGRKGIHIGLYDTPEEAHAAYLEAKRKLHEGCTL